MIYGFATQRPEADMGEEELRDELRAARRTIRALEREVRKAEDRYQELARAYQMTVSNLVQATGTCTALEMERDMWRDRAEGLPVATDFAAGAMRLSRREITAIRKAMARLHHPDVGGDAGRMRAWNALLDALEGASG